MDHGTYWHHPRRWIYRRGQYNTQRQWQRLVTMAPLNNLDDITYRRDEWLDNIIEQGNDALAPFSAHTRDKEHAANAIQERWRRHKNARTSRIQAQPDPLLFDQVKKLPTDVLRVVQSMAHRRIPKRQLGPINIRKLYHNRFRDEAANINRWRIADRGPWPQVPNFDELDFPDPEEDIPT